MILYFVELLLIYPFHHLLVSREFLLAAIFYVLTSTSWLFWTTLVELSNLGGEKLSIQRMHMHNAWCIYTSLEKKKETVCLHGNVLNLDISLFPLELWYILIYACTYLIFKKCYLVQLVESVLLFLCVVQEWRCCWDLLHLGSQLFCWLLLINWILS